MIFFELFYILINFFSIIFIFRQKYFVLSPRIIFKFGAYDIMQFIYFIPVQGRLKLEIFNKFTNLQKLMFQDII